LIEGPGDFEGDVLSVKMESGELSTEQKKLGLFVKWLSALSGK
jgi:hypothetical protein